MAAPPAELEARQVEQLVEASDAGALKEALEAQPDAIIFDFDDTFSPTAANIKAGYDNLKMVSSLKQPLLVLMRPRPLYMHDLSVSGELESATLNDLCAFVDACRGREFVYVYLPKLEFPAEAEFWNAVLAETERQFGRGANSIRVCIQIETLPGAFYAQECLHALRNRAYGLNAGRWDYVFSAVKHLPDLCLPPRSGLQMNQPSLAAYEQHLARVCARRGAQAIGGTAAVVPEPHSPEAAFSIVQADKQREASHGFVAAWAGLPELIPTVRAAFQSAAPAELPALSESDVQQALLNFPQTDTVPLDAVQDAIGICLDYFGIWLSGQGVIIRNARMEDTATAELARAQVWQWVRHGVKLDGGQPLTATRFEALLAEQTEVQEPAARLLSALVLAETCPAYFPAVARELGLL